MLCCTYLEFVHVLHFSFINEVKWGASEKIFVVVVVGQVVGVFCFQGGDTDLEIRKKWSNCNLYLRVLYYSCQCQSYELQMFWGVYYGKKGWSPSFIRLLSD